MVRTNLMGQVTCEAKVESTEDLLSVRKGVLTPDKVRAVNITDALVDTGASTLGLPTTILRQLSNSVVHLITNMASP